MILLLYLLFIALPGVLLAIRLQGMIIASRKVSSSINFLDLIILNVGRLETLNLEAQTYSQVLMKEDRLDASVPSCSSFSVLCKICSIGSIIEVECERRMQREHEERPHDNTLIASKIDLIQCAPVMTSINRLVGYARDKKLSPQQAADALNLQDKSDVFRLSLSEIEKRHMLASSKMIDPKRLSSLINENKFKFNKPQSLSGWSGLISANNIDATQRNNVKDKADMSDDLYESPSSLIQGSKYSHSGDFPEVTVLGMVSNRYRIQEGLLVDIVDAYKPKDDDISAKLRVLIPTEPSDMYYTYYQLVNYGAVFKFTGLYDRGKLVASNMSILLCGWQQKYVEHLVQKVKEKSISTKEAITALALKDNCHLEKLLLMTSTELRWEVVQQVGLNLQQLLVNFTIGGLHEQEIEVLDKYAFIRRKYPIERSDINRDGSFPVNTEENKRLSLRPPFKGQRESRHMNHVIDLKGRDGSRWQRKKQPQVIWMMQKLETLLQNNPAFVHGERKIKIVDVGVSSMNNDV